MPQSSGRLETTLAVMLGIRPRLGKPGDVRQRRDREGQAGERSRQRLWVGIIVELGRAGLQRRCADDHLRLLVVVDAHLDLVRDVGGAAPRAEPLQVLLERERRRAAAGETATAAPAMLRQPAEQTALRLGARRLAEEELALRDADLEADLLGAHPQEVPVGLADLRDVPVGRRRVV